MKFTTLISSTTPFLIVLVALLLHNPSSSIVAANEDVFSFSTASSTTDNKNAEESVSSISYLLLAGFSKFVIQYLVITIPSSCPQPPYLTFYASCLTSLLKQQQQLSLLFRLALFGDDNRIILEPYLGDRFESKEKSWQGIR